MPDPTGPSKQNSRNNAGGMRSDRSGCSLQSAIIMEATGREMTICVAESCTGGLLGGALTETAGSSLVFLGGAICYTNLSKMKVLGVDNHIFKEHGAVSAECALAMAEGARMLFGADISCAITGIAGPGGGSDDKPVGLVWFSILDPARKLVFSRNFHGNRQLIRKNAVETALEGILNVIGGCSYE